MELTEKSVNNIKHFNLNEALKHFNGDMKLFLIVMKVFIDDMPQKYNIIRDAIKRNDLDTVCKTAHAVKGGALYAGAQKAHSLALRLEKAAAKGNPDHLNHLASNLMEAYESYKCEAENLME